MDTHRLVDPAPLPVRDVFPTIELSNDLLAPMGEAERFAQLPIHVAPEITEAIEQSVRTLPGPAGAPDITLTIIVRTRLRRCCRASLTSMAAAMSAAPPRSSNQARSDSLSALTRFLNP